MTFYKEILIGVASVGLCFGVGRGVRWLQQYDWHKNDQKLTLEEAVEQISELEETLKRIERRLQQIENLDLDEELAEINAQIRRVQRQKSGRGSYRPLEYNNDDHEDNGLVGKHCTSQRDCGGKDSGYFCNYGGNHTKNTCEKTNALTYKIDGVTYYYNKEADLNKWCREATESYEDRQSPGNCNWGYLSYSAAQAWCESIGKSLIDPNIIKDNCDDFDFLPKANQDQQYWTKDMRVIHTGRDCSIQNIVRGDGYSWAGGVICR